MTIDHLKLTATIAANGTATATSTNAVRGRLVAINLDYTSAGGTCDVTITCGTPALTLLVKADNQTDSWFFPVGQVNGAADGAAISDQYTQLPLFGTITMSIAQGTEAGTVAATLVYEKVGR